jgi:outer membrane protein assembly factor BamB
LAHCRALEWHSRGSGTSQPGNFSAAIGVFDIVRPIFRLALSLLSAAAVLQAQEYPQWRGPQRDGSAGGFVEPATWPEKLMRQWSVEVGEGYSTPIIVGMTIYVFSRQQHLEVLRALDASTGTERWQSGYSAPYTPSAPAKAHGAGPKATPLFHRSKVYTLGICGIFSAFHAETGKRVWQTPEPSEHPFFSAASSPVGYGELVIAHPGNYEPLTAFEADTGKIRWVAGERGAYASPMIADFDGERQVVTVTQQSVIGVSLADGRVLWRHPWKFGVNAITPVLYADMVIVSGQNMGVTALRPMRRASEWSVEVVWQTKEISLLLSDPVVVDATLFGLSNRASGQYFAVDANNGKVLWLGDPREATNTAIAKAGSVLFLLNDDGELIIARSSRKTFEAIRRYPVSERSTWAQPAISGKKLLFKDSTALTMWSLD